jgi:hypothetical protein
VSGTRPKGYMQWTPRPEHAVLVGQVRTVLAEYASYCPMTVRQVFYRLVGEYGYDKTELAYKRLAELLVKARRSQLIGFSSIRDDGTVEKGGDGWLSRESFWQTIRHTADHFRLDRQGGQPQRIEVWCEAAGMAPMLAQMTHEWSVPVYSTGGFSSVTVTYETAQRYLTGRPTVMLHVGDYDPSGESIFTSMTDDITSFLYGHHCYDQFTPVRVALTQEQVDEHDLPTAPPKRSDSRSANWYGETTQAEALPPDLLAQIIQDAVREYIDEDVLAETLDQEATDVREIDRVLQIAEGE